MKLADVSSCVVRLASLWMSPFYTLPEDLIQFTQVSSQKANMLIDTVLRLVWAYPLAFSTSISEK